MTTLSFPAISAPSRVEWSLMSNSSTFTSPLSGAVQTIEFPGARWAAALSFPVNEESNAALLEAFLMRLRGQAGRFWLQRYGRSVPRGTITLTGVTVNGATAIGATSVVLAGAGNTKTLLAGDYFSIGNELKICVADATSSSGGAITVTFEPPARAIFAHAAAVTLNTPLVQMMLKSPESKWRIDGVLSEFSIDCVEAF